MSASAVARSRSNDDGVDARPRVAVKFSRSALALAALWVLARCGGAVDREVAPDGEDAACVPGTPGCTGLDASLPEEDATSPPDATSASDSGDAPIVDASDAPVEAPTDAPPCTLPDGSGYECDPIAQCGCDWGMACDLIRFDSSTGKEGSVCRPAGIAKPYTHCADDTDCRPGFTCVLDACRRICESDSQCDGVDPYRKCVNLKTVANQWGQSTELPYGTCVSVCDPAFPTSDHSGDPVFVACGQGLQCSPALPAWVEGATGLADCRNWSDQPRLGWGAPCKLWAECEPGFACEPEPVDGGLGEPGPAGRQCRRWCHVGTLCNGEPCVPVGISAGPIELGFCPL